MKEAVDGAAAVQGPARRPVVATIGAFDGIHRGHHDLLGQVVDRARSLGLDSLCVTFDPHPDLVLYPERKLSYLADRAEKERVLHQLGLDHVQVIEFTLALSMLSPEEFLGLISEEHPLAELWVGSDFALGRGRSGTIAALADLGRVQEFALHVVPPRRMDREVISSTFIRSLLAQGNVRHANRLLGRRYRIGGIVEGGMQRGRTIGFPTANIKPDPRRALPADGVYAAVVPFDGVEYRAVVNLGSRPTFKEGERLLEVHLLDATLDLYGKQLDVDFVDRLRDTRRFDGIDALRAQIGRDANAARTVDLAL
ncbi:MAG: bifunctional riboflavin kinase/FAD synthetase [Chloroflexi bacterium]|nr:bifunctional riboflavin kinase/FAD synthetase [Chloroflexota bacterium]